MPRAHRASRGISLIEALVALAVMGFGTLAVLGVQTSLRLNGDVARQRSEALGLARQTLQQDRTWVTAAQYGDLASTDDETDDETVVAANTTFTLRRTVEDNATDENQPRRKTITVDVTWTDRAGRAQAVSVSTALQAGEPLLAASLVVPSEASTTRNPGGRHRSIPPAAYDVGDGRSRFDPPAAGGPGWVFNNVTGFIERVCTGPSLASCTPLDARLLSGFVQFATTTPLSDTLPPVPLPPTATDAELPPGTAVPVDVEVATAVSGRVGCFEWPVAGSIAYACAVPVDDRRVWSGRSEVVGSPVASLPLAASRADADAGKYRVCRYTPARYCHPAVGSLLWGAAGETASCTGALPTPSRAMRNADHPLDYVGVDTSLLNQNFLVIRAGDGATAFDCPADGSAPFANTNTWHHQPPT
jgi:Tfp pilus assembly protein PilV